MSTLLDLKTVVANQLGANDASTPTTIRDNIINQARREFYSERPWSYLIIPGTSVTLTSRVGSLPSGTDITYNAKFDPIDVYTYDSNGTVKYQYEKVNWADVESYSQSEYVYAINRNTSQIKVNQTGVSSIKLDYIYLPSDKATDTTDNTDVEPAPDITPIALLAIAKWWLASERGTGKYQLFKDEYKEALSKAVAADANNTALVPIYPRTRKIRTSYWGRW